MTEQASKGPAAAWTGSVKRCELAAKVLKAAIDLWDECGSVPKLEALAWSTAEAARAGLTMAQENEKKAFKRLKEAQSQLSIDGTAPTETETGEATTIDMLEGAADAPAADEVADGRPEAAPELVGGGAG